MNCKYARERKAEEKRYKELFPELLDSFSKCFMNKVMQTTTPKQSETDNVGCDKTQEQSEKADELEAISDV